MKILGRSYLSVAIMITLLGALISTTFATLALAKETSSRSHSNTPARIEKIPEQKLTGNRLRACQRRQPDISTKMQRIGETADTQLGRIHEVAEKTKRFYEQSSNKVAGYEPIVTEADSLYSTAQSSITSLKNIGDSWSCADKTPRQNAMVFNETKRAQVAATNAYKDKIVQLITLLKSAAKEKY